jgi:uncharacterized protein with ParB-like and HNH nuclease domain
MFFNSFIAKETNLGLNPSYELIDGQQRITSLFLLYFAIYTYAMKHNFSNIIRDLNPIIFKTNNDKRMRLRGVTNSYLEDIINDKIPNEKIVTTTIFDNFNFAKQ